MIPVSYWGYYSTPETYKIITLLQKHKNSNPSAGEKFSSGVITLLQEDYYNKSGEPLIRCNYSTVEP